MARSPRTGYLAGDTGDRSSDRLSRRFQRVLLVTGMVFFAAGLVTLFGVSSIPPSKQGPPGGGDSPDAVTATETPTTTPTPAPNQETVNPAADGANRTETQTDEPIIGVGL